MINSVCSFPIPRVVVWMVESFVDFAVHMFTQTYASHVMQTALSVANKYLSQSIEEESGALEQRPDQEPLEPLGMLINLFVQNIMVQLTTVCTDVNGSHVLRYLLCILMGCPHRFGDVKKYTEKGVQRSHVCSG